jgi:hypothetical protein
MVVEILDTTITLKQNVGVRLHLEPIISRDAIAGV